MNTNRELDQLLLVAEHYLSEARRLSSDHPAILMRTPGEVAASHITGQLAPDELLLAHLGSCAIRLCTICEKVKCWPVYRNAFYERNLKRKPCMSKDQITKQIMQDLDQHIHFLLRDNVGHEENVTDMASDRFDILMALTIRQALTALDACAQKIRARLT